MKKLLNILNQQKELIYLLILLVGYVVVSSLSCFLDMDSQIFAVPYRFIVFFLSIYILFKIKFIT